MKKQLFFLLIIITFCFLANSCSDQNNPSYNSPLDSCETVSLSFSVELDAEELATRDIGDEGPGNGNRINNLVFALYTQDSSADDSDDEGDLKPVLLWDPELEDYATLIRIPFEPSKTGNNIRINDIEIIKGIEYTLMLWAQYRPDEENDPEKVYFELRDDGLIRIRSYKDYNFPNNDDKRDVFCGIYKIVQYEDSKNLKFTLRRPFAQINVGAKEGILRRAELINESGELLIDSSSITISGDIANKYNLFKNIAAVDFNDDGNTKTYQRVFAPSQIPAKTYPSSKLVIKDRETNEEEEYVWLSMCYILPNGELGDISHIDIKQFSLFNDENEEILTTSFENVPALRNRRTNIILGLKDFNVKPWQDQVYTPLPKDNFKDLIDKFRNQPLDKYEDSEYLSKNIDDVYGDNIILDDDGYKCIMLGDGEYKYSENILPVQRNYVLYGTGENCIVIKNANSNSYHNTGQVRNLTIQDQNGNYKIFIDREGYIWIPKDGELTRTKHHLPPLTENFRSYDIYCNDGHFSLSTYYH